MVDAPFVHVVLFSLPEDAGQHEATEILNEIDTLLRPLPTVHGLWAGSPADTKAPDRPMIDDDYDIGLLVLFENKQGLDDYLEHPDHVVFAKKWDSRCTVRVLDFLQKS